jgi:hypothetical protein
MRLTQIGFDELNISSIFPFFYKYADLLLLLILINRNMQKYLNWIMATKNLLNMF